MGLIEGGRTSCRMQPCSLFSDSLIHLRPFRKRKKNRCFIFANSQVHGQPLPPKAPSSSLMQSLLDMAAAQRLQQQHQVSASDLKPSGATVYVRGLTFHPPGSEAPLLSDINMTLPANSLNLIIGRRCVISMEEEEILQLEGS